MGGCAVGKETARALLAKNAKVYLACRSPAKTQAAVEDLKATTGKSEADMPVLALDLSDLASIKAAVDVFLSCVVFSSKMTRRILIPMLDHEDKKPASTS